VKRLTVIEKGDAERTGRLQIRVHENPVWFRHGAKLNVLLESLNHFCFHFFRNSVLDVSCRRYERTSRQIILSYWNGEWYRWTGCAYRKISTDEIKKAVFVYLRKTRMPVSRSTMNAVLEMARLATLVQDSTAPTWLSKRQPHPAEQIVAVKNGLLHLPSLLRGRSTLSPHTPAFFSLNALHYDYQKDAICPQWEQFLSEIWGDDAESIRTLQEWFGYLLLPDTRQQKFLMLIGPTRSGKGTIARVVRAMLGAENVASPTMRTLSGHFGLWGLVGKLLAIVPDASVAKTSHSLVELIKSLTGEDALDIERKSLSPLSSVNLRARLMVIANQVPGMVDPSGALGHRILALETRRSWAGKEDRHLTDKLFAELPGILVWSLAGWRRLQKRGYFRQPQSSQHLVQQCLPPADAMRKLHHVKAAASNTVRPARAGRGLENDGIFGLADDRSAVSAVL
jgi:putative DNA primase/helicase